MGEAFCSELLSFLRQQSPSDAVGAVGFIDLKASDIKDGSKEARKEAHAVIQKHFSFLSTETVEVSGERMIRIWMKEAEKKAKAAKAPTESLGGSSRQL